ncbi:RNA-directed DNA polymerase (Reverse transcriptase) [Flexistipes sinusarabici DSM 4947]|uniref:RNA-directed DNA polymerase (Reverse transcriptase) n=1 Tax=Flexistipes sinusarabici (strain ATCC 49648 / DSM 4947 / MAS 10) TaxID=717231 RepID=F8E6A8_FLESM|nr:group II intron reverse transcriptase/maturase [Flexistipes sinusarabici]AEI15875.1 RNA-directed DNA polymerase (Reverse transcriptase) [Flexistipes sinusarabici DSM 4947]
MAKTQDLRIRKFQQKLYVKSKQELDFRFYSLYDKLCSYELLEEAYRQCKINKGKPGVDGETFSFIEESGLSDWLTAILELLKNRKYKPRPVKRVMIPKPGGGERPLGIPTIRDRVVQTACKILVEPILEARFDDGLYGYRPQRSSQDAVKRVKELVKMGYKQVYDCDLSNYFDNIPHDRLMEKLERHIVDKSMLKILRRILQAPVQELNERGRPYIKKPKNGTPQGGVISPLFANLYLNDFIRLINEKTPCEAIGYADDFVILYRKDYTNKQLDWIRGKLEQEGLELNETKTSVVNMSRLKAEFDFLGFNLKMVRSHYTIGGSYIRTQPSRKSQQRYRDKVRKIVKSRTYLTFAEMIKAINRLNIGWYNYFDGLLNTSKVYYKLDWFIVRRFYRWSQRLSQRKSRFLTPSTSRILIKEGLIFLAFARSGTVKGFM